MVLLSDYKIVHVNQSKMVCIADALTPPEVLLSRLSKTLFYPKQLDVGPGGFFKRIGYLNLSPIEK